MDYSATPPNSSGEGFEPWEIALVKAVVHDHVASHPLPRDVQSDDLVQECLLHWWQQRHLYDSERGASRATYMRRVLRAKLIDITREELAAKRRAFANAVSLDESLNRDDDEGDGDDLTLNDIIPDKSADWQPAEAVDQALLKEHIDRVVNLLSPLQRQLVQMLRSDAAMAQISRSLGIPRATLYDELSRIRAVFRDEGLQQLLG